jgi:predicted transcriptional regulator of viral defense system
MDNASGFIAPPSFKRTRLATAVLEGLTADGEAVTTRYEVWRRLLHIWNTPKGRGLFRGDTSGAIHAQRVVKNLIRTHGLTSDPDYGRNVYRVLGLGDAPAEEVFALATPFGYVAHLSAMQRWGLTDRRPDALHLVVPAAPAARRLAEERMAEDRRQFPDAAKEENEVPLTNPRPPAILRGRKTVTVTAKEMGRWIRVRGGHTRLATVGQTFLDMLDRPDLCGGMAHVRDVWREHADIHLEEIAASIDDSGSPIVKVRAGYLLDELLGLGDDARAAERIAGWLRFAQRGSSRVLDPSKPFATDHSEKWMLSLNV